MKISDIKGIFKKSTLTIVSVEHKHGDYYQIIMKPEVGVTWNPGEHGIFTLPDRKVQGKKWRAFSIASIPEENVMIIGTRTGKAISNFKKELISMKKGDKVTIRGPFGWFKVQDLTSPIVMVVGGVGITPIMSILKQLKRDSSRPVELLYASSEYYLFDDEIQAIALENRSITIHKTHTNEETSTTLATLVDKYRNEAYYFISGAPSFIRAIKKQLKNADVKGKRIINDPFFGY